MENRTPTAAAPGRQPVESTLSWNVTTMPSLSPFTLPPEKNAIAAARSLKHHTHQTTRFVITEMFFLPKLRLKAKKNYRIVNDAKERNVPQ